MTRCSPQLTWLEPPSSAPGLDHRASILDEQSTRRPATRDRRRGQQLQAGLRPRARRCILTWSPMGGRIRRNRKQPICNQLLPPMPTAGQGLADGGGRRRVRAAACRASQGAGGQDAGPGAGAGASPAALLVSHRFEISDAGLRICKEIAFA